MEIPHSCRGFLMLAEHLLHPGDVVPASELVATLMEDAGHLVAEALVKSEATDGQVRVIGARGMAMQALILSTPIPRSASSKAA